MRPKGRLLKSAIIAGIIISGLYSFNYLDYWSKANPANIVEAIKIIDQDNNAVHERGQGLKLNRQQPSSAGVEQGHGRLFRGEKQVANPIGNLSAFLGVFVFTLTITYLIDKSVKNRKIRKQI